METKKIEYHDGDTLLEGYLAYDKRFTGKLPAVLVIHDWSGRNELAQQKAEKLAELGYVGFAVDMYGKGIVGQTVEEKKSLMQPLMDNRHALAKRITAALTAVREIDVVDKNKVAAIGFCFGGLCALDLARSGANVSAVVSFHGLLFPPKEPLLQLIKAKILVLHGYDDPMVPPEQVIAFTNEMTAVKADWQLHIFSNTMHGFTNPQANDPGFGTVYNKLTDQRAWSEMQNFLVEVFG